MSYIKDPNLRVRIDDDVNTIQIYVVDKVTKSMVCLGHVQGNVRQNAQDAWIRSPPDTGEAEKVRDMFHQVLNNIQDLT